MVCPARHPCRHKSITDPAAQARFGNGKARGQIATTCYVAATFAATTASASGTKLPQHNRDVLVLMIPTFSVAIAQ